MVSGNHAPQFMTDRIRAALAGELDASFLSEDEASIFDELVGDAMGSVMTPAGRAFWASFESEPNTDL